MRGLEPGHTFTSVSEPGVVKPRHQDDVEPGGGGRANHVEYDHHQLGRLAYAPARELAASAAFERLRPWRDVTATGCAASGRSGRPTDTIEVPLVQADWAAIPEIGERG